MDVVLAENALHGALTDAAGKPLGGRAVWAVHQGRVVGLATTDVQGRFQIEKLRAGRHEVMTDNVAMGVRLWTASTAPPLARNAILLVQDDDDVVLGQNSRNLFVPLALGLVVAAAIIIPLALGGDDDHDDAS